MAVYLLLCTTFICLQVAAGQQISVTNPSVVLTFEDRLRLLEETLSARSFMESNSVDDRLSRLERTFMSAHSGVGRLESQLIQEIIALVNQTSNLAKTKADTSTVGVSFIRWGRTVCNDSDTNATTVYTGYVAGPHQNKDGGGANFLCLNGNPQWSFYQPGFRKWEGLIYGTELESYPNHPDFINPFSTRNNGGRPVVNNPLLCAACYVPRQSTSLMIPARTECPRGWTLQYKGYIQSEAVSQPRRRSSYLCVDEAPEVGVGGINQDQAVLYTVEVGCGSLPCSPFIDGAELACVVCTR